VLDCMLELIYRNVTNLKLPKNIICVSRLGFKDILIFYSRKKSKNDYFTVVFIFK